MDTPRPHQNPRLSVPQREPLQGFSKDTISKCPLLLSTPTKIPYSQPAKKDDGERHTFTARANPKENFLVARIDATPVHNSTCSTPIKTPFGTPSQLQATTSKPSFLSASKSKHFVGVGGCGVNEDASITRTPFRLLAGKNLNACLFSPSQTPRPIGFPVPLDKLASPSLEGHAKRVLVTPRELSPARRVPVKQIGSRQTPAGKQSLFTTPKSSRVDSGRFVTPKSSRVDNVSRASGQNDDGDVAEHHVMHSVDVNYDKVKLERPTWLKKVIASLPRQSPFATPISSRAAHLLKTAGQNNAVSDGNMVPLDDPDEKHGRAKLDGLELLIRALASMPQLSSPARRVPLRKKQNPPLEKPPPPSCHKEKQQSSNQKAMSENPETCKSSQRRKQTCPSKASVLDGKRSSATKQGLNRVLEREEGNDTGKTSRQSVDNHSVRGDRSRPKGKGEHDTDKAMQQRVDNHANKSGSSKPKGKRGHGTSKTKQQSADNHANKSGSSKPKGKEGNGTDKTKQLVVNKHAVKDGSSKLRGKGGTGIGNIKQQSVDKHVIKGGSSKLKGKRGNGMDKSNKQSVDSHAIEDVSTKQHDEDISKTCGDDSVDDKGIDVNVYYEDQKQCKACDNDIGHEESLNVGIDTTQLCGGDGANHRTDDFGDNDRCQSADECINDKKQNEDSLIKVGGGENFMVHYGDGSEHNGNDNCREEHDHHDGNDEKK